MARRWPVHRRARQSGDGIRSQRNLTPGTHAPSPTASNCHRDADRHWTDHVVSSRRPGGIRSRGRRRPGHGSGIGPGRRSRPRYPWWCDRRDLGVASAGTRHAGCRGLVVAPGFVDLHQHSFDSVSLGLKAHDGVTSAFEMEGGVPDVTSWYASSRAVPRSVSGRQRGTGDTVLWPPIGRSTTARSPP